MRILFVSDIIGRPGRETSMQLVPKLRNSEGIEFVIANAENAAGGRGITPPLAEELFGAGINVMTLGNHTFDRPEAEPLLGDERVLRPANYPGILAGSGWGIYQVDKHQCGVISLMGRHELAEIDCPFQAGDRCLKILSQKTKIIIVDMHAEATSEKQAMGWYLDGRASAVIGTHTHVQTADERLLPEGTAFITDVGMTGPLDSVIGMKKEAALKRFLTGVPTRMDVPKGGDRIFSACILDIDDSTGKALEIKRIYKIVKPHP